MGRYFDRLCSVVERQMPGRGLKETLKKAAIFEFPGELQDAARAVEEKTGKPVRDYSFVGGVDFLMEHFFLPFPVIAVEDAISVVVIADGEEGQQGLDRERRFIECEMVNDGHRPAGAGGAAMPADACVVTLSRFLGVKRAPEGARDRGPLVFLSELGPMFTASKRQLHVSPPEWRAFMRLQGIEREMMESAAHSAKTALEEVMYFNTPDRFVVRRSPERLRRKGARGTELLRSNERDHYILLKPEEIRQRFGVPDEPVNDRKSPRPHARRRHYRTLRSDRFKEKKGKTIVVPASWVGPTEGEYEGRRYAVCLDL